MWTYVVCRWRMDCNCRWRGRRECIFFISSLLFFNLSVGKEIWGWWWIYHFSLCLLLRWESSYFVLLFKSVQKIRGKPALMWRTGWRKVVQFCWCHHLFVMEKKHTHDCLILFLLSHHHEHWMMYKIWWGKEKGVFAGSGGESFCQKQDQNVVPRQTLEHKRMMAKESEVLSESSCHYVMSAYKGDSFAIQVGE